MQPQSLFDLNPGFAKRSEEIKRICIDYLTKKKYDLVEPCAIDNHERFAYCSGDAPLTEHFIFADPLNGSTMMLRPDITPQVARIDVEMSQVSRINRFCYSSTVYRAKPEPLSAPRNQHQIGAELFGIAGLKGDVEMIVLLARILKKLKIGKIHIDLGNVTIFKTIVESITDTQVIDELLKVFSIKSHSDLNQLAQSNEIITSQACMLHSLIDSYGEPKKVLSTFTSSDVRIKRELQSLKKIIQIIEKELPWATISIDLGELHGYSYKSGLVFSAYTDRINREIARGGRYDGMYSIKKSPRPGIGFSFLLDALLEISDV